MTNKEILQADMLDILFEHRNKSYGAYALRKTYSRRLGLALGVALSIGLLFALMSFINKKGNGDYEKGKGNEIVVRTYVLPDDKPKDPEPPKEKTKPKAQAAFQKIVVVPDNEADKDIVKNDEPPGPTREPGFPGGPAAWLKFLQRSLQAPEDIEPGRRIEVYVRFWVDVDGSVSRAEIIKSGGNAFDKEVLRVVKKMPKWEPALQAGRPIAVAFQQPVIFIGEEQ